LRSPRSKSDTCVGFGGGSKRSTVIVYLNTFEVDLTPTGASLTTRGVTRSTIPEIVVIRILGIGVGAGNGFFIHHACQKNAPLLEK